MAERNCMPIRLLLLVTTFTSVKGARVLLSSTQFVSHVIITQAAVGGELAKRGHDVYVAVGSTFPAQDSLRKTGLNILPYHTPKDAFTMASDEVTAFVHSSITDPAYDHPTEADVVSRAIQNDCQFMLSDEKFMHQAKMLKFDIAFVDPFVLCPCPLLLLHNLSIPFVTMTVFYHPWFVRLPALPSFHSLGLPWTPKVKPTTWHSLLRTVEYMLMQWGVMAYGWNTKLLQQYAMNVTTWNDLLLKSELFLIDSDHLLEIPLPLFANVVQVPGITVNDAQPLSGHLEQLFRQSVEGAILVSFGSTAHYIPENIVKQFLEAFSRLNQTVIAKLAADDETAIPKNVKIMSWLPQNDIVGHPRTKLFITHCGNSGQHEAFYHGVPMLGFPMFGDQKHNCERAYVRGFGLQMIMRDLTSEELYEHIQELLNNESYSRAIKRHSAIWRSEPLTGRQKAAHWIEHVVKFGGQHLRSPAMDLPIYRFLMLDVLAVLLLVLLTVAATATAIIVCIIKVVRKKYEHLSNKKKLQ